MNIHWNTELYHQDFSYVAEFGKGLFELMDLRPGATVLDLGCGAGDLTEELRRLGYQASGMDASPTQIEKARQLHPGLPFAVADATDFNLPEPVDAVFSNAMFHWIDEEKQPSMLRCIAEALKPGGRLICEFGGSGNNAAILHALETALNNRGIPFKNPFYFPSIGEYAPLIESHGMQLSYARLFPRPTPLKGEHGPSEWIRMFIDTPFKGMKEEEKRTILAEVENSLRPILFRKGIWQADYIRLRLVAIKIRTCPSLQANP